MKKAFTLIELIFVIVVIGIIATFALPKINNNDLQKAAIQVIGHIRYTQHLAMSDDKFDSSTALNYVIPPATPGNWFNKRWRINFTNALGTGSKWSYTVFDDRTGSSAGTVGATEIAVNPLNRSKKLSGGAAGTGFLYTRTDATKELNIGKKYGIKHISFSNCGGQTIAFDYLGRPLGGAMKKYISSYDSSVTANIVIINQCVINLCTVNPCPSGNSNDKISIAIEPETGYAHVL